MYVKFLGLWGSKVSNSSSGLDLEHPIIVCGADVEWISELGVLQQPTTQAPLQVDEIFDADILAIPKAMQDMGQGADDPKVYGEPHMSDLVWR